MQEKFRGFRDLAALVAGRGGAAEPTGPLRIFENLQMHFLRKLQNASFDLFFKEILKTQCSSFAR